MHALCCRRHTALVRLLWRHARERRGADKSSLFPCRFLTEYAHLPRQARYKDEELKQRVFLQAFLSKARELMREIGNRCGNTFYAKPFSDETLPFAKTGSGQM